MRNRNDFSFRPAGLRLFNEFNAALEVLNNRLILNIRAKSIANPFADDDIFQGESDIKTFLVSLSHNSNLDELIKHLPFTEEEKNKKTELEKKYDDLKIALSQKDKALKELRNIKTQLAARKNNMETINLWFKQAQLDAVKTSITDCITKEDTAQKEGVEKFKTDKIKNIGSSEWKQFIEAAETFAITQKENGVEYPEIGDNCLLCHQPINEDVPKNLIASYWAYIKSVAEQEAKTAKEYLEKTQKGYKDLDLNQFPETDTLSVWLNEKYEIDLTTLKKGLEHQKTLGQNLIANIKVKDAKQQVETQLDLSVLDKINSEIDKDIKAYEEDEQSKVLAELLKQKTYLAHKEKLASRFSNVEALHKNFIWVNKANRFNKQGYKTQSTTTEKRLSKQFFNANYIKSFNEECEYLNGKFGIEIDARSSDAQSNRQLFLKGKDPSSILSEGEQKVIALADFFAETNITTISKGIVFDDPVNSLDEERKKVIAKRLCELSQNKQVVIFTHDLVFVSALINYCTDFQITYRCHSIENLDEPGKIFADNTPSHEAKYKTSAEAWRYLKLAKDAEPELREAFIKSGFAALRSSYEAFVIFDLFCGAVKRFDDRVSIDSLKELYFDANILSDIMENFKLCCRYMEGHIHSDKYLASKPQIKHLQEEADRFDTMRPKLRELKKEHKN